MKNFYYYLASCILGLLFGLATLWAGVDVTSPHGWPLLLVFWLSFVVGSIREFCAEHRAKREGFAAGWDAYRKAANIINVRPK